MNEQRLYRLWEQGQKDVESLAAHARDVAQERLEVRTEQGGGVAEEARLRQDEAVTQNTPKDVPAVDPEQERMRETDLAKAGPPPRGPSNPGEPAPNVPRQPEPPNINYEATAKALDDVLDMLHAFKRGARPGLRGVRPSRARNA